MLQEQKVKILLVDDQATNLTALQAVLEPLGQELVMASSGRQALRCVLEHDFAVILMDVRMPGMDGIETATIIRSRERSRHTPIIFLTAVDTSDVQVARGYSAGAVDYILKPFDPLILRSKVGVFVDLFKMTEAVKLHEEHLRDLNAALENAVEGIARLSADQRHVSVNNAYASMLEAAPRQVIGADWKSFVHPEDLDHVLAAYRQMITSAKAEVETRVVRQDGSVRLHHLVLVKAVGKRETFDGFYCFRKDVTEQRHWEARAQLANIVESSSDAIYSTNLEGQITSWNPGAERIYGYKSQEVAGQSLAILQGSDEFADLLAKIRAGERLRVFETVRVHKDGRQIDVSISISPMRDPAGNLIGASIIARDITEHKRLERELLEKNLELEKAIRTRDRFLATISHELRTPLNAIIGFAGILLMRLSGPLTEKQERQLTSIEASAQHLHMLINDLLDLSRIESGKVTLKFEPVNCRSLVDEVATTLGPLAEKKGLEFRLSETDDEHVVQTDQRACKQVLINLVSNAIKFTEKGWVRLGLERLQENGSSCLRFRVEDSGVGIKQEDRRALFEPFERGAESPQAEGTGLGLYLSKKLSELIGGRLEFESELGKGSTFTLVIPQEPDMGDHGGAHSSH